ncbi:arabinan endo-1,5-alpha-L-arabinosidase [Deinococcus sp. KSM4-11]|uniref:family 43 glycosylhydrolase n=1 Tax=Deinococcus sp. KSM4-11 TaxID=2568654 RepID=UPI0010A36F66|nr:family 43 glycosylhydrolase [Deinococcus sp. KSM4-11]THF85440.1 arabinan endo-1,5-alpha-L-arabinosidase [Deinococcus sp. KSM4-11]
MKRCCTAPTLLTTTMLLTLTLPGSGHAGGGSGPRTYTNPLDVSGPQEVVSCPDPSILGSRIPGDTHWYAYCTSDPHSDAENNGIGNYPIHPITMLRSADLTHWELIGDALPDKLKWASDQAFLWAPEIVAWPDGTYHLYYAVSQTLSGGSAIGVAVSASPTGPWVDSGRPVVEPQGELAVLDPAVVAGSSGRHSLYFGSFRSGIAVRELSPDGLRSDPKTQIRVAAPSGPTGFGGPEVVRHGNYYYLFGASSPCCAGPMTGNGVFVGRSTSPTGPFLDRTGRDLNATWAGGTPVVLNNGGRWVGPGMGSVFSDAAGRDWLLYHAIDQREPYFEQQTQISKRHLMLDPVDWVGGWPTVRNGHGPSDGPQPAPVVRPGDLETQASAPLRPDRPGAAISARSDEFSGTRLGPQWRWVRPPAPAGFSVAGGAFSLTSTPGDLMDGTAPALLETAPTGDYVVETRLNFPLPEGAAPDGVEAGLVVYWDDHNFVRLTVGALGTVRVAAFYKATTAGTDRGFPSISYGLAGSASPTTWLRIVKRTVKGEGQYTAYVSTDSRNWERGGTWTLDPGGKARVGLVALSGAGYPAHFAYLRVSQLSP